MREFYNENNNKRNINNQNRKPFPRSNWHGNQYQLIKNGRGRRDFEQRREKLPPRVARQQKQPQNLRNDNNRNDFNQMNTPMMGNIDNNQMTGRSARRIPRRLLNTPGTHTNQNQYFMTQGQHQQTPRATKQRYQRQNAYLKREQYTSMQEVSQKTCQRSKH